VSSLSSLVSNRIGYRVLLLTALLSMLFGSFHCCLAGDFDLTLVSLNPQNFPYIYLDVSASDDSLPESAFTVYEDGTKQTDQFQVVPPSQGGGVKVVDIAFLMDNSGSMDNEQAAVAANVDAFVDALDDQGFDYALGLCRFGAGDDNGFPILEDAGALTEDPTYFLDDLWARNTIDGGFEPGWDAICDAAAGFNFRPGALKVLILITDENVTGDGNQGNHSKQEAIDALDANGMLLFALIDQDTTSIDNYGTIAQGSGGAHYDVEAQFDDILQEISGAVGNTYRISYKSSDPTLDGIERTVDIEVASGGQQDSCSGTYIPGAAPTIVRTQATVNLGLQPWAAGTQFTIQADVEDTVAPDVQGVTLHYRTRGEIPYTPVEMTPGSTRYTGNIPGGDVEQPGIEYYISATDGQSTVTAPSVGAAANPYQIAIFPNVRPLITHVPIATYQPGAPVDVTADVVDQTNLIDSVSIFCRNAGQLVYQEVPMQPGAGNSYEAQIPQGVASGQDIEYYVKATDDYGVSSYSCGDPDAPHVIAPAGGAPGGPVTEIIIGAVRFKCPTGFTVTGSVYSANGEVNVSDLLYFIGSIELDQDTAMVTATGRVEVRTNLSLIGTLVVFTETTYEFDASDFEFLWTGNLTCGFDLSDILPGIGGIEAVFVDYEFVSLTIEAHLEIPLAKDPNEAIRIDIDKIVITKDGITDIEVGFQAPEVLGFPLEQLEIDFEGTRQGYRLDIFAIFQFPWPYEVGVEVRFGLLNGKLNTLIIIASDLNFLVYTGPPGMWLEKLGGGVEDLQIPEQTGWYFTAGMSFAPVAPGPKVVFVDGEIKLDAAGTFEATVGIRLFDADNEPFANGKLMINSSGGYVKGDMTITVLRLDGTIAVGADGAFGGYLTGTVAIQRDWPIIGLFCCGFASTCRDPLFGFEYPCNWQCQDEVVVPVASVVFLGEPEEHAKIGLEVNLGPLGTHGLTYTEDPGYTEGVAVGDLHIGTNIQKLREAVDQIVSSAGRLGPQALGTSFRVDEKTPFVLAAASWDRGDMDLAVVLPSGEVVNSAQMILDPTAYQYRKGFIQGEWRALVVVNNPQAGEWTILPDNVSGVETYDIAVYGADPAPSVDVTGIRHVGNTVEIDWETRNADGADLWFFRTPSCGTLAGASAITSDPITVSGDSGTYTWDATGTPTGVYYISAIVDDQRSAPRTACSGDAVSVVNPDQLPAPTNLAANRIDNDSVELRWDYAGPAGSTKGFIAYYTNEPHAVIFTGQLVVLEGETCTLDGLPSTDRYCFAVAAVDEENNVGVLSSFAYIGGGDEWSNRPPVFDSAPPDACQAGTPMVYLATAVDPDGDPVTYSLVKGPTDATLDEQTGLLTWTPTGLRERTQSFEIDAEDGFGGSASQAFTLDVTLEPTSGGAPLPIPELEDAIAAYVGQELVLDGCIDAAPGQSISYLWEVVLAPSADSYDLISGTSCSTGFRARVPGTFRLRLTATDSAGTTTTLEIVIEASAVEYPGQVICAPNPVRTEGVAFFYETPPNTRDARILIYGIDGRLITELELDPEGTRHPSVGTWQPQDESGRALANGAYLYVLVADNRVIDWKKLVIYR